MKRTSFFLLVLVSFAFALQVITNLPNITKNITIIPKINVTPIQPLSPIKNVTNITPCQSCTNLTIPEIVLNNSEVGVCDPSLVNDPHYNEYSAAWYHVEEPYYIDSLTDDCSVFGFEPNITDDLNLKLLFLNELEIQVNDTETLAIALFNQGNDSLEEVEIAAYQHDPNDMFSEPMEPTYPSVSSRYHDVELSYPAAGMNRVAVQEARNFYYAYEYAINAKNDTRALKMSLQSLAQALENYSDAGGCMFEAGKEYYADLLRIRYIDTLRYINETRRIISHARDFASSYSDYKEHIDQGECLGQKVEVLELPHEIPNINQTQNNLTVPKVIADKFPNMSYITSINYSKNESYIVEAKLPKKLLGFIPVEMEVTSEIDAETGDVIREDMPWWSFLVFS